MFWDLLVHWARHRTEQPASFVRTEAEAAAVLRRRANQQAAATPGLGQLVRIGELDVDGSNPPLLLTREEATGHGLVLGRTGSGKTYWALSYAQELVRHGFSIGCVSPHPDLDDGFLRIARQHRLPVVHLDFGGRGDSVTPFSFLKAAGVRPDELAILAVSLFEATFGAGGAAGAIRSTLWPLFFLIASFPDELSLLDVDRLVLDAGFAQGFLSRLVEPLPQVVSFFAALAGKQKATALASTRWALARVHALLAWRGVRLTLCSRPYVDLREVLRCQVALVVSVPAASLGDNAGLLAGLVVEHLRLLLMQRPMPCSEPQVFLFLDELGSLVTGGAGRLGAFLAEARKFSASLLGLCQSLSQLERNRDLLAAFQTNASLLVLGRLSPNDAMRLGSLPAPSPGEPELELAPGTLWVEGVDAYSNRPKHGVREPERRLEESLRDAPSRVFHAHLPLEGQACTIRFRSLDLDLAAPDDAPALSSLLLSSLPVGQAEDQVRQRLAEHAQAASAPGPSVPPAGDVLASPARGAPATGARQTQAPRAVPSLPTSPLRPPLPLQPPPSASRF